MRSRWARIPFLPGRQRKLPQRFREPVKLRESPSLSCQSIRKSGCQAWEPGGMFRLQRLVWRKGLRGRVRDTKQPPLRSGRFLYEDSAAPVNWINDGSRRIARRDRIYFENLLTKNNYE